MAICLLTLTACTGAVQITKPATSSTDKLGTVKTVVETDNTVPKTFVPEAIHFEARRMLLSEPSYLITSRQDQTSWSGRCEIRELGCTANYPHIISITPLADNVGKTTYTGTINLEFFNAFNTSTKEVIDATFKVNFDDNSILLDSRVNSHMSLSMRTNFTSRGIITGTTSLNQNEGATLGIIGQTEMVGLFLTSRNSDVGFAGSFTASHD